MCARARSCAFAARLIRVRLLICMAVDACSWLYYMSSACPAHSRRACDRVFNGKHHPKERVSRWKNVSVCSRYLYLYSGDLNVKLPLPLHQCACARARSFSLSGAFLRILGLAEVNGGAFVCRRCDAFKMKIATTFLVVSWPAQSLTSTSPLLAQIACSLHTYIVSISSTSTPHTRARARPIHNFV